MHQLGGQNMLAAQLINHVRHVEEGVIFQELPVKNHSLHTWSRYSPCMYHAAQTHGENMDWENKCVLKWLHKIILKLQTENPTATLSYSHVHVLYFRKM